MATTSRQGLNFSDGKVVLPTGPVFFFRNQSFKNSLPPATQFPALGHNNTLCPVAALKNYVTKTSHLPHQGVLFVIPVSGKPLAAGRLSSWLVKAIRLADPLTPHPAGHDVRKLGHSIAFARGLDPQDILRNGFWHSPNLFIHKYLIPCSSSLSNFIAGRFK